MSRKGTSLSPRVSFPCWLLDSPRQNQLWQYALDPLPARSRVLTFFSDKMPQFVPFHYRNLSSLFGYFLAQLFSQTVSRQTNPFQDSDVAYPQNSSDGAKPQAFQIQLHCFLLQFFWLSMSVRSRIGVAAILAEIPLTSVS